MRQKLSEDVELGEREYGICIRRQEAGATAVPSPWSIAYAQDYVARLPTETLAISSFCLGASTYAIASFIRRRYFVRIPSADWVTPDMLKTRWFKGRVTAVNDSDNFRFYHTPGFGFNRIPEKTKLDTISIRIAAVDAPEGGHFKGQEPQPHYADALRWFTDRILGETVYCKMMRKDIYGRIVAVVRVKPPIIPGFIYKGYDLSETMLRAGWAVVYKNPDAEYGDSTKAELLAVEEEARSARRGMWKNPNEVIELPSEYKRRYAAAAAATPQGATASDTSDKKSNTGKIKDKAASLLSKVLPSKT
ncbi:hypothetical protein BC629DRAFT_1593251 [Irpex lacteus]|nr:hypothetical protein BC629DRAFT_1593251 [Irpex lacteus]